MASNSAFSDIEFKASTGQFNIDQAQGIVECFVAGIGNKDSVGDVLLSGAFKESLKRRKPRVVWGHNWNDPIGKVLEIYEVSPNDPRLPSKMKSAGIGGLYARVQFNLGSEKGREAFANVAFFGEEQEWSIGYKTLDAIFDPNLQANVLKEVELYEVSPVLHGANQLTGTISVKSDVPMMDDEKCGPGMPHAVPMATPPTPRPMVQPKPVAQRPQMEDPMTVALRRELVKRTGSTVVIREHGNGRVVFDRVTSDGNSSTYQVPFGFDGAEFSFGKPIRVIARTIYSPAAQDGMPVVPQQMPSMPMMIKPQGSSDMEYQGARNEEEYMPYEKSYAVEQEVSALHELLSGSLEEKIGRALSTRNLSKLKNVVELLQEIIGATEKDVETKTELVIHVDTHELFNTKSLLDPILDFHRVDSYIDEQGIHLSAGVTPEFLEALETLEKGLGKRLRGIGRFATGRFDANAVDGDNDGRVQEGTAFERPAMPGIPSLKKPKTVGDGIPAKRRRDTRIKNPKTRKEIMQRRARGQSLDEVSKRTGVSREVIRQFELRTLKDGIKNWESNEDFQDFVLEHRESTGKTLRELSETLRMEPEQLRQAELRAMRRRDSGRGMRSSRKPSEDEVRELNEGMDRALPLNKPSDEEIDAMAMDDTAKRIEKLLAKDTKMSYSNNYDDEQDALRNNESSDLEDLRYFLQNPQEWADLTPDERKETLDQYKETISEMRFQGTSDHGAEALKLFDEGIKHLENQSNASRGFSSRGAKAKKKITSDSNNRAANSLLDNAVREGRLTNKQKDFIKNNFVDVFARGMKSSSESRKKKVPINYRSREMSKFLRLIQDDIADYRAAKSSEEMVDDVWVDNIINDMKNSGTISVGNAMDILNMSIEAVEREMAKPKEDRNESIINQAQESGKAARRILVDGLDKDEISDLTIDNARRQAPPGEGGTGWWGGQPRGGMSSRSISRGDGMVKRDERGNILGDEGAKKRLEVLNGIVDRLRGLGFTDDEIATLMGGELPQKPPTLETDTIPIPGRGNVPRAQLDEEARRARKIDTEDEFEQLSNAVARRVESDVAVEKMRKGMESSGKPITNRPLSISLSQDEIGELLDEAERLKRSGADKQIIDSFADKLRKAKNGNVQLTAEEANSIDETINSIDNLVTSDIRGVIDDAAYSKDGKLISLNWQDEQAGKRGPKGLRSGRSNNGAPSDITPERQKYLIDWAMKNRNLTIASRILNDYEKEKKLPAKDWRALNTLHDRISESRTGFRSSRGGSGADFDPDADTGGATRARRMGDFEGGNIPAPEGRPMGFSPEKKLKGKTFDEVKPDNWDKMSNEEKFEWLLTDGSVEKSGMREVDHKRMFNQVNEALLDEEEGPAAGRARRREARAKEEAAAIEQGLRGELRVEPRPQTPEEASRQRKKDAETVSGFIKATVDTAKVAREADELSQTHEDAWDDLDGIFDEYDLSRSQIKKAIERIKQLQKDSIGEEETASTKESLRKAAKLLNTLEKLDKFYAGDRFISDTPTTPKGMKSSQIPQSIERSLSKPAIDYLNSPTGFRSENKRPGRTEIIAEATWFGEIERSLPKEIRAAQSNNDSKSAKALQLLQTIMRRQESSKVGDRRTNVGKLLLNQEEADEIMDAIMNVIDRQGEIGGEKRQEMFAQLIDKIASAAMSTFIDKTTPEIGSRKDRE